MTPGARESDALLVAMYEGVVPGYDAGMVRAHLEWAESAEALLGGYEGAKRWATDLGFGALVTGDYGEVGNG